MSRKSLDPEFHGTRTFRYNNIREAFSDIHRKWIFGEIQPQMFGGPRGAVNDICVIIDEPDKYPVNLLTAGFKKQRWKKFLNDYCDQRTYSGFMSSLWSSTAGQEVTYYTKPVAGHSLGNCVMSLSVNGHTPHRLKMNSRTCQWTPTATLDLNFAAQSAMIASEILQLDRCMPIVWDIGLMQYMVVAGGVFTVANGDYDELRARFDPENPNQNIIARDVLKHIDYALEDKQTPWRTFMRFWAEIRKNLEIYDSKDKFDEFYPTIPSYLWSPFQEGKFNAEQLEERYGQSRKWIRFRIRPYRKLIHDVWGLPLMGEYDLMWSTDHPEFKILEHIYHHGGSVHSIYDIVAILGLEDETEAYEYCRPYYEPYRR